MSTAHPPEPQERGWPLGEPIRPHQAAPMPDSDWRPVPGSPGIEINSRGNMRTNIKQNGGDAFSGGVKS